MNERERILELVKKGVLSTEEALDLLEEIGKRKEETIEETQVNITETSNESMDDIADSEEEDKKNLEEILERLAEESNQASAELDELNVEIEETKLTLSDLREALMEINTKEEFDQLTEEELNIRLDLEEGIKEYELFLAERLEEKAQLEGELKNIRRSQWSQKKEEFTRKIEIPEDWKEQANETISQVGEKVVDVTSQMGKFLKKTIKSVAQTVEDNVEWKDINIKFPGVATTKFDKEYLFENATASILEFQIANGDIAVNFWDQEAIKIEANIKLYGKMEEETPLESFERRSEIMISEDRLLFKVPNKRVRIDLVMYLPRKTYDYASIKLLNGNVLVNEFDVKDLYIKSVNGDTKINNINASMVEIDGVNGNISILSGNILDSIIESVNSSVRLTAAPNNLSVSLVNGDIRLSFNDNQMSRVKATTVNGDVKVAWSNEVGFEGEMKTSFGNIHNRLSEYEMVREKKEQMNKLLQIRRIKEQMAQLDLSTTTGSIYLKDAEVGGSTDAKKTN